MYQDSVKPLAWLIGTGIQTSQVQLQADENKDSQTKKSEYMHNAELQRADPGTKVTG